MNKESLRAIVWVFLTGSTAAFAAPVRAPANLPDVYGGDRVNASHALVKVVAALTEDGDFNCTGTFIDHDLFLTAAHCLELPGKKGISTGVDVRRRGDHERDVISFEMHPKYIEDNNRQVDGYDIALVRFSGGLPPGSEAAPFVPVDYKIEKDQEVTAAGYGTSRARSGSYGSGILRTTTLTVSDPAFGRTEFVLDQSNGYGICFGDSGGPALVNMSGIYHILGVADRVGSARCGDVSYYSKIHAHAAWIKRATTKLRRLPQP
jgi:secreted trypsin-like serine protease